MADYGAGLLQQGSQFRAQRNDNMFARLMEMAQFQQNRKDRQDMFNQEMGLKQYAIDNKPESAGDRLLGAVMRYQAGEGTPEDEAFLKAQSAIEGAKTQYSQDPITGALMPYTQPALWDRLTGGGQDLVAAPSAGGLDPMMANREAVLDRGAEIGFNPYGTIPENPPRPGDLTRGRGMEEVLSSLGAFEPIDESALNGGQFLGGALSIPTESRYDGSEIRAKTNREGLDALAVENLKAEDDQRRAIELEREKADIGAVAKGAETMSSKTAEYEASKQGKLDAIGRIRGNIEEVNKLLPRLPQGMLEQGGAFIAGSVLGRNTDMSAAMGEAQSLLPAVLADLKKLVRDPGEGNFTDADQKVISGMVIRAEDPLRTKASQLETLDGIMRRYEESLGGSFAQENAGKPGFKYLGVE